MKTDSEECCIFDLEESYPLDPSILSENQPYPPPPSSPSSTICYTEMADDDSEGEESDLESEGELDWSSSDSEDTSFNNGVLLEPPEQEDIFPFRLLFQIEVNSMLSSPLGFFFCSRVHQRTLLLLYRTVYRFTLS